MNRSPRPFLGALKARTLDRAPFRARPDHICVAFFRGKTTRRFVGHTKDVMSVAFSADNRQIVSGSRDKTIKLWNTLGVCKYTITVCVFVFIFTQL